jgi:dephospho-CoA kinase
MLVALTGGIGSGKSLAGELFEELGAIVVDSDQLSRDVIERGTPGFDEVISTFGDAILKDGLIDRKALGEIVFKNEEARKKLEAIIHPAVRAEFNRVAQSAPAHSIVINQIPLLVETNGASKFDVVIHVTAPLEVRTSRLLKRGMHASEIEARIAAQVGDDERKKISHYTINNDGDRDDLLRQVEAIYEELKSKA